MENISVAQELSLLENNVLYYYSKEGERFAYFICKILLDNEVHDVRIAVRKLRRF